MARSCCAACSTAASRSVTGSSSRLPPGSRKRELLGVLFGRLNRGSEMNRLGVAFGGLRGRRFHQVDDPVAGVEEEPLDFALRFLVGRKLSGGSRDLVQEGA